MRDFTFVFRNLNRVFDDQLGLYVPAAHTVKAKDLDDAITKLSDYCSSIGWVGTFEDYVSNIKQGNIEIIVATKLT